MARKAPDQDAGEALRRFKSDLKAGTLGNFYIISGEEAFLRSHYVDLITKKIADGPAGEFNCHRFSADDCTPQALADAIDAMPMMAERTLVRVDDVDLFKQPEGAREQYAAIFSDLPDYCCVLFVYDTVEFKINGTMKKLAAAIREHAQILTFGKQSERDLCAWITRHFRAHDKMVTDELCQYLIFRTDGLMTTLAGEIDKIAAYQQGPAITRGAIDAVVIPALSAQTFDISDAVVKEDFETALSKLQELYAMQTDPIAVLGAIGAQLRRLFYARVILSAGGGQKELMELTGLKSYPAGLTMTAARRVTDGFCQKAVELVLQGSFQGGVPPRRIDAEKNFLGVEIFLFGELSPLQSGITAVHCILLSAGRLNGCDGTAPAGGAGAVSASSCCCSGRLPAKSRRPDGGFPPRRSSGAVR